MNALRQIVKSKGGILKIDLPKEYQKQSLEVIIFPIMENQNSLKTPKVLANAHKIIDAGCDNLPIQFIQDYENHLKDREIPRI